MCGRLLHVVGLSPTLRRGSRTGPRRGMQRSQLPAVIEWNRPTRFTGINGGFTRGAVVKIIRSRIVQHHVFALFRPDALALRSFSVT
jgi:hypothetical protein